VKTAWALGGLVAIVAVILWVSRRRSWQPVFRWLPVPLWCYALPLIAVELGGLPAEPAAYRLLTDRLLPVALGLLLVGVDLPAIVRAGGRAVTAALIGATGIVTGAAVGIWVLQAHLPREAWKGAGALAGTWTGGTMNLLALRSVLGIPDPLFAPLIVVDAVAAYSWMALLIAASGLQHPLNRWLRACATIGPVSPHGPERPSTSYRLHELIASGVAALGLASVAQVAAQHLPASSLISSSTGWTVLLVTSAALGLSLVPWVRRVGARGGIVGYPCLYVVLAATGSQARLEALWSAPVWIAFGLLVILVHGILLLLAGRLFRIPLGVLATASQANIGGVVSGPLVGAVYHPSLAPVGLLLALAGNAAGTYLGLLAASACRAVIGQP